MSNGIGNFLSGDFMGGTVAPIAGMLSTGLEDVLNLFGWLEGLKQRQPGAWGKVSPEQAAGWPMPGVFGGGGRKMAGAGALGPEGGGELLSWLREIMPNIAGMPLMLEDVRLGEEAKQAGIGEAEGAIQTIAESVPAERLERLRSLDPTVISQLTFDKNAAAIIDSINRQARKTAETQTAAAGARGLSPDAIASIRSGTAMTGRREAMGDIAQLDLTREMVNDEAKRAWEALIGNLGAQLGGQYEPFRMAKVGLEATPPDLSGILNAILQESWMKSQYDPALIASGGNIFGRRGEGLLGFWEDYQGRKELEEAEPGTDWWTPTLGLATAGLSLIPSYFPGGTSEKKSK